MYNSSNMTTAINIQDANSNSAKAANWWESAEDHRFALEVLQLPLRRKMLYLKNMEARS